MNELAAKVPLTLPSHTWCEYMSLLQRLSGPVGGGGLAGIPEAPAAFDRAPPTAFLPTLLPPPRPNRPKLALPLFTNQQDEEFFFTRVYKVSQCPIRTSHSWQLCCGAHDTENARRRDPYVYHYSCQECPAYKKLGTCPLQDSCEYSHGQYEALLHPDAFRTRLCNQGGRCSRTVCFFAHTLAQLRPPSNLFVANQARKQMLSALHVRSAEGLAGAAGEAPVGQSVGLPTGALAHKTVAPCSRGANGLHKAMRKLADAFDVNVNALETRLEIALLTGSLGPGLPPPLDWSGPRWRDDLEALLRQVATGHNVHCDHLRAFLCAAAAELPKRGRAATHVAASAPKINAQKFAGDVGVDDGVAGIAAFWPDK